MKKMIILLLLVSLILAQSVYSQECNLNEADLVIIGRTFPINEAKSQVLVGVDEILLGQYSTAGLAILLTEPEEFQVFKTRQISKFYLKQSPIDDGYFNLLCGIEGVQKISDWKSEVVMPNITVELHDEWLSLAEKYGMLDEGIAGHDNKIHTEKFLYWNHKKDIPKLITFGMYTPQSGSHEKLAKNFLEENKEFLQVDVDSLKFSELRTPKEDTLLQYSQEYKGIPVYAAYVKFIFHEDKRMAMYANNYFPDIDISTKPGISERKAVNIAKEAYQQDVSLFGKTSYLVVYPEEKEEFYEYHLAYLIDFRTMRYIVDANTGDILHEQSFIMTGSPALTSAAKTGLAVAGKAYINRWYIVGFIVLFVISLISFLVYKRSKRKRDDFNPT